MKDLGCRNGWKEEPGEYQEHEQRRMHGIGEHHENPQKVRRCLTRYTCNECGITWTVDSGD